VSAPLSDFDSYSVFIYTLPQRHAFTTTFTLALARIGATLAKLEGSVECQGGLRLEVWELIDFASRRIRNYSYEVYRGGEKIRWYDHWEHPEIPALAATFPHHKHVPPNLRDNRVPAPGLSFEAPNLPAVLEEVWRECQK
jgi:hypothetical protein